MAERGRQAMHFRQRSMRIRRIGRLDREALLPFGQEVVDQVRVGGLHRCDAGQA